jgi:hypothetical protein
MFLAAPAKAEGYLFDGQFGLGTGLEGGDPGTGSLEWQRARLRVIAGIDLRSDEDEAEGMGFRAFAEVEKRGSVGGEARYTKWMSRAIGVHGGILGTVAPETLFGAGVGATLMIPMGRRFGVYVEPTFSALPLGSDLPGDTILMWALLSAGVRLGL